MSASLSDMGLVRVVDDLVEAIVPAAVVQHQQAAAQVIDKSGAFVRDATLPFLPVLSATFGGSRVYIPSASTLIRVAAYATTPPTSGVATITVTIIPPGGGEGGITTFRILQGDAAGEAALTYDLPAGSWLSASVTTANGASGVSIAASWRVR